jgi:hypothetical protein
MSRFSIGSHVRIIGGLAEHYNGQKLVVTDVDANSGGLSHLNRYRVLVSDKIQDAFYEFQLTAVEERSSDGDISSLIDV